MKKLMSLVLCLSLVLGLSVVTTNSSAKDTVYKKSGGWGIKVTNTSDLTSMVTPHNLYGNRCALAKSFTASCTIYSNTTNGCWNKSIKIKKVPACVKASTSLGADDIYSLKVEAYKAGSGKIQLEVRQGNDNGKSKTFTVSVPVKVGKTPSTPKVCVWNVNGNVEPNDYGGVKTLKLSRGATAKVYSTVSGAVAGSEVLQKITFSNVHKVTVDNMKDCKSHFASQNPESAKWAGTFRTYDLYGKEAGTTKMTLKYKYIDANTRKTKTMTASFKITVN